jgi:hypothetical protein
VVERIARQGMAVADGQEAEDDLADQAASARGAGSRYSQLLTPELWLPCRFEFAVLLRLAARSDRSRVPMKLDF